MESVRKSAIAGSWYLGRTSTLKRDIEKYFDSVPDFNPPSEVVSLVAPHAGYIYSGQVAVHAYKLVLGKKNDAVIVVGSEPLCCLSRSTISVTSA